MARKRPVKPHWRATTTECQPPDWSDPTSGTLTQPAMRTSICRPAPIPSPLRPQDYPVAPRPTPPRQRPVREHIDITNLRISQGHGQPQFATITTRLLPSNDATSSRHNVRIAATYSAVRSARRSNGTPSASNSSLDHPTPRLVSAAYHSTDPGSPLLWPLSPGCAQAAVARPSRRPPATRRQRRNSTRSSGQANPPVPEPR